MIVNTRELYANYKQTFYEFYEGQPFLYDGLTIFYDPHKNYFIDEDGYVIYELFEFIPPFVIQEYYAQGRPRYFVYNLDPDFQIEIIWDADAWDEEEVNINSEGVAECSPSIGSYFNVR